MDEVPVTVHLPAEQVEQLRLRALRTGHTVSQHLAALAAKDNRAAAGGRPERTPAAFATAILDRVHIDPASEAHQAAAQRALDALHHSGAA